MATPYKTDCYYYTEVHDMGACISQCTKYKQIGKCPCENCINYISNKEVHSVIQDYVRNKQNPCEDCISRQVVKDMLTAEWTKYMPMELDMNLSFVLDKISALPSVTPKTEWIPVSEKLPEDFGGDYLISIAYRGTYVGTDVATYVPCGYLDGLWDTPNDWIEGTAERWHVTAWMPLPAPYKESEE